MDEYIEDFLNDVHASKSSGTYEVRKTDLTRFHEWLELNDLEVVRLDSKHVHQFLREQGNKYSDTTVKSRFDSVKLLFDFLAGVWDVIEESPLDGLQRSEYTGRGNARKHNEIEEVYVSKDELELLAEHVPSPQLRNELIIRLLWQTGVRRQELAVVELDDIDTENRSISVYSTKTGDTRTVFYQPSLDFLMNQWLNAGYRDSLFPASDSPYLLVTQRADHIHDHTINEIVKQAAENAGIQEIMYEDGGGMKRHKITAHSLRHGHAVYALKCDIDIRTVQKHLGHKTLDMTLKYLRLVDKDVKDKYHQRFGVESTG